MSQATLSASEKDQQMLRQLEGKPRFRAAYPVGLQHVLAMFTGNLAPILIVGGAIGLATDQMVIMMQCAMFVSGLTTLIQLYPIKIGKFQIGAGLPIVMGTSFAFVSTAITVGGTGAGGMGLGIAGILGACMAASFVEVIMGVFFKSLKKFFPPLVVGSVLVAMGIKLLGVGAGYFTGANQDAIPTIACLGLAFLVLSIVVLMQRFGKGLFKVSGILIALIVGYVVAALLGYVDFTSFKEAELVAVPIPWEFRPTFNIQAIALFSFVFIVSGLETIGNTSGITIAGFDRQATPEETSGAILADALGSTTAAVFNSLPNTAFGQNAGLVSMTKVVNKWAIALGAITLMVAGLFPPIGALFAAIPDPVLGGAVITIFAMILLNGMKMISKAGFSERNMLVLGLTFGLGIGLGGNPLILEALPGYIDFIFADTVVCVCIVSILTNIIFPITDEAEKELAEKVLNEG